MRSRALLAAALAGTGRQFERSIHRFLSAHVASDTCYLIFVPDGSTTLAYLPGPETTGTVRRKFRDGLAGDFWLARCRPEPGETLILRHSDHTPISVLRQTAFYRERLQPEKLVHGVSLVFWNSQKFIACLTLLRKEARGDFRDEEMASLRLLYFEALQPLVRHLAHRHHQEHSIAALRRTIYLSDEPLIVAGAPDEVIAASKLALRILLSWPGNGSLSHKLPRGRIPLPGAIRKWASSHQSEILSLHPRWTVRLTALAPKDGKMKRG